MEGPHIGSRAVASQRANDGSDVRLGRDEVDSDLRLEVQRRRGSEELRSMAIEKGMRTLLDDGLRAVRAGVTTLDEVLRVARA